MVISCFSLLSLILFIAISFFISCILLRYLAPNTYKLITEKHQLNNDDMGDGFIILIIVFLFWPVVLICILIMLLVRKVLWPLFCKLIKITASIIPNIK